MVRGESGRAKGKADLGRNLAQLLQCRDLNGVKRHCRSPSTASMADANGLDRRPLLAAAPCQISYTLGPALLGVQAPRAHRESVAGAIGLFPAFAGNRHLAFEDEP